jgi:predicted nucleic acid-binding protein
VKTALLDLNILTALLLWPAHEHHEAAHRWFAARRKARWATCAITDRTDSPGHEPIVLA